jgi:antitoxin CptB
MVATATVAPAPPLRDVAPSTRSVAQAIDERRLARIRWRCRRGMLENDLILARFLDLRGAQLCEAECAALDRLLDLSDNELWDALSGRSEPSDPMLGPVLAAIRSA